MRCIATFKDDKSFPVLGLYVHGAPHRRMHRAVFDKYRTALIVACEDAGVKTPIDYPVDLFVVFIDPTSPDLGNVYLALERCLDGKTRKGVLTDDSLIHGVKMMKMYPHE